VKKTIRNKEPLAIGNDLEWTETSEDLAVTTTVALPKKAGKKFFNDLDAFFESAIDDLWKEPVEERLETNQNKEEPVKQDRKGNKKSFFSGLDALFSNTAMPTTVSTEEDLRAFDEETLKRVTFLFKKDKLDALKNMAKKEKLYLRDIISRVLDQYIEEKGISASKNQK